MSETVKTVYLVRKGGTEIEVREYVRKTWSSVWLTSQLISERTNGIQVRKHNSVHDVFDTYLDAWVWLTQEFLTRIRNNDPDSEMLLHQLRALERQRPFGYTYQDYGDIQAIRAHKQ